LDASIHLGIVYRILRDYINCKIVQIETGYIQTRNRWKWAKMEPKWAKIDKYERNVTQHYIGCRYTLGNFIELWQNINCKIVQIETGYIQNLQETGENEPKWSQNEPKLINMSIM